MYGSQSAQITTPVPVRSQVPSKSQGSKSHELKVDLVFVSQLLSHQSDFCTDQPSTLTTARTSNSSLDTSWHLHLVAVAPLSLSPDDRSCIECVRVREEVVCVSLYRISFVLLALSVTSPTTQWSRHTDVHSKHAVTSHHFDACPHRRTQAAFILERHVEHYWYVTPVPVVLQHHNHRSKLLDPVSYTHLTLPTKRIV